MLAEPIGGGDAAIWLKKPKYAKKLLPLGRLTIIITTLVKQVNGYHSHRCR